MIGKIAQKSKDLFSQINFLCAFRSIQNSCIHFPEFAKNNQYTISFIIETDGKYSLFSPLE
jgi:hypothetical protein